jgi:hypothetical protein
METSPFAVCLQTFCPPIFAGEFLRGKGAAGIGKKRGPRIARRRFSPIFEKIFALQKTKITECFYLPPAKTGTMFQELL